MGSIDTEKAQQFFVSDTALGFPGTPRSQVIGSIPADAPSTTVSVSSVDGSSSVSARVKYQYLAVYFAFNLGLTIYNKVLMGKFPFPYLLTSLHTAAGSLGCQILLMRGAFTPTRLGLYDKAVLVAFSFLYTINIAISNASLNLVTIPFHQVIRATTPIFTIIIYRVVYSQTYSHQTYLSLIPTILGVACATYGDYYFSALGFLLTVLGAFLAAMKTVTANRIQTGRLHLSALEILYRMSPLALIQALAYAYLSGEVDEFRHHMSIRGLTSIEITELVGNAGLAFGLNIISFTANKKTGGLTMTVAANLKQILTIVLSVLVFGLKVGWWNGFGIILTLLGGAWYAKVELESKPVPRDEQALPPLGPMTDMKFDKEASRFV